MKTFLKISDQLIKEFEDALGPLSEFGRLQVPSKQEDLHSIIYFDDFQKLELALKENDFKNKIRFFDNNYNNYETIENDLRKHCSDLYFVIHFVRVFKDEHIIYFSNNKDANLIKLILSKMDLGFVFEALQ